MDRSINSDTNDSRRASRSGSAPDKLGLTHRQTGTSNSDRVGRMVVRASFLADVVLRRRSPLQFEHLRVPAILGGSAARDDCQRDAPLIAEVEDVADAPPDDEIELGDREVGRRRTWSGVAGVVISLCTPVK